MAEGTRLIIIGKQGAGKRSKADRLSRQYGMRHNATGDIFRAATRSGSETGKELDRYMRAGDLVPDPLVFEVMAERLKEDDARQRGFILDGFPRNAQQAEKLSEMLSSEDVPLAVNIEVPTDVALHRLAGRRVCRECGANYHVDDPPEQDWTCDSCGGEVVQREDDNEEAINRRLQAYEEKTEPLIAWYLERDKLVTVDGVGSMDEVTQRLVQAVDKRMSPARSRS